MLPYLINQNVNCQAQTVENDVQLKSQQVTEHDAGIDFKFNSANRKMNTPQQLDRAVESLEFVDDESVTIKQVFLDIVFIPKFLFN